MKFPLWFVILAGLSFGFLIRARVNSVERLEKVREVVAHWPKPSRMTAAVMIDRYGAPDAFTSDILVWGSRVPWKRIALWRQGPDVAQDDLEQTVAYDVPGGKTSSLADLNGCVRVSDDGAALSARAPDERLNRLALNLADEVLRGVKTPEEARDFYNRTLDLAASGRSSRYMEGLILSPSY